MGVPARWQIGVVKEGSKFPVRGNHLTGQHLFSPALQPLFVLLTKRVRQCFEGFVKQAVFRIVDQLFGKLPRDSRQGVAGRHDALFNT